MRTWLFLVSGLAISPGLAAQSLVVDGGIESQSSGFKFPDGTVQSTAAVDTNAETVCEVGLFLDGGGACVDLVTALEALQDEIFARLVFVSSETFTGAEVGGGLGAVGGDDHCQRLANAAGHQGRFLAWLSDDPTSPLTRFTQSDHPYRLIDGTVIADDFADLTDGQLAAPIALDEYGVADTNPADDPWTGTLTSGAAAADHCNGWTDSGNGLTGNPAATTSAWTESLLKVCGQSHRLYCFQQ